MFGLFRSASAAILPFRVGFRLCSAAVWFGLASFPAYAQPLLNVSFVGLEPSAQFAAASLSSNDFWNLKGWRPGLQEGEAVDLSNLKWADMTDSPVTVWIQGESVLTPTDSSTNQAFVLSPQKGLIRQNLTVTQLPSGLYRFFVYGHYPSLGGPDARVEITSGGINFGSKPMSGNLAKTNSEVMAGAEMAVFSNLEIGPEQTVNIRISREVGQQFSVDALQVQMIGASSNEPKFYSSVFTSIERFPNGDVRMRLVGPRGAVIGIESSTNLLEWIRLTTLTNTGENVNFTDPNGTKSPTRFFRVVPP